MVALSDPDDRRVSFRSQQEFVEQVKAKGLPILHITASAGDEDFHGLSGPGRQLAIDCAADMDDDALAKKYQNKTTPVVRPLNRASLEAAAETAYSKRRRAVRRTKR